MSNSLYKKWTRYDLIRSRDRRHRKALDFVGAALDPGSSVLDLGTPNVLGELMSGVGYQVTNTDIDLDERPEILRSVNADAVTAFEILEHLVNPRDALRALKPKRLFATVPLALWFAHAFRDLNDPWNQHFHEFEDWQFDWLIESAGNEIVRREKWTSPTTLPGFRPILRSFVRRYYAVEAIKRG